MGPALAAQGRSVLRCPVERGPYREPDFAYRKHGLLKLTAVPTLIRVKQGDDGPVETARLVEDECCDGAKVVAFCA